MLHESNNTLTSFVITDGIQSEGPDVASFAHVTKPLRDKAIKRLVINIGHNRKSLRGMMQVVEQRSDIIDIENYSNLLRSFHGVSKTVCKFAGKTNTTAIS